MNWISRWEVTLRCMGRSSIRLLRGQVVYLLEVDFAVARRRRSKSSDVWSSGSKMCLGTEIGDACICMGEKLRIFTTLQRQ
jgi:hypothetical protein